MTAPPLRRILTAPPGYGAREAASFVQQMDDQSRRLTEDTRGATASELEWQWAPGTNTIGMLLAHIAIVEGFWISFAVPQPFDSMGVLGVGEDDDGMPAAEGAPPPAALAGKPLEFFDDLLARARAHTKEKVRAFTEADLERECERTRNDGSVAVVNVRWILYHVLEHEAGHYGQVNLLRHQHRLAAAVGRAGGAA